MLQPPPLQIAQGEIIVCLSLPLLCGPPEPLYGILIGGRSAIAEETALPIGALGRAEGKTASVGKRSQ